jgi:hypothetical protein
MRRLACLAAVCLVGTAPGCLPVCYATALVIFGSVDYFIAYPSHPRLAPLFRIIHLRQTSHLLIRQIQEHQEAKQAKIAVPFLPAYLSDIPLQLGFISFTVEVLLGTTRC